MIWGTLFHIMIKVRFFLQIMSHAFLAGLWRHIVQAASFLCLFERQERESVHDLGLLFLCQYLTVFIHKIL